MAVIIEGNLFESWTRDLLSSERLKFSEQYEILLLLSRKLHNVATYLKLQFNSSENGHLRHMFTIDFYLLNKI